MNHRRASADRLARSAALLGAWLVALAGPAHADPVALDYHAKIDGCPTSERFGDEVAAKLGFVPWEPQAPAAIRIRIDADGDDLVATLEQPDGSSKVLRAATCPKLDEILVSAVAVVLDKTPAPPAAPPEKPDERRLRTLARPATSSGPLTLNLHTRSNRVLEISRVEGSVASAYGRAMSFERICKLPCEAHLLPGNHSLLVRDVATDYTATADATIKVNSTLEIDYTSHDEDRRTTTRRMNWGFWLGLAAGAIGSAYIADTQKIDSGWTAGLVVPIGGLLTAIIVGRIAIATAPGMQDDEAVITVRPGLDAVR